MTRKKSRTKEIKYRNPYAKALQKKLFRQRIVKSGKVYSRKSNNGDIYHDKDKDILSISP